MTNYFLDKNSTFAPKTFPIIDLGDYILREQGENDIADFFAYFSDPKVAQYILCPPIKNIEEARRELYYWRNLFYNNQGIYFAIADKKDNKMIGSIGFNNYNSLHQRIELSYDLAHAYWRRGIMTKAINAVVNYVFNNMPINRIEAYCASQNTSSILLLKKCKFIQEGLLRGHRLHLGKFEDVYIFSLLKQY